MTTIGYVEIQRDVSGGGPRSLLTLLERLDRTRFRPIVFVYGRGTLAEHLSRFDIPVEILDDIVQSAGFHVRRRSLCNFPPVPKLSNKLGIDAYNNYWLTIVDSALSNFFSWNIKYHRTKLHEKFAPASVFYVLERSNSCSTRGSPSPE